MKDLFHLAELISKKFVASGYTEEDIKHYAIEAILESKNKDVVSILKKIKEKLRPLKNNTDIKTEEKVCYNDGEYNALKEEVLDLFSGQERDILSLIIQGYTNAEIAEILSLKETFVNLKRYYIRKKIKLEWLQ